jgi:hypothetical protein
MQLSFGTFIRSKANPYEGIFVGVRPYNDTQTYSEYQNIDQWGQGFYDDDVRLYGGPAKLGQTTHIEFDFIAMVDKALKNTGKTHKDYYLSMIGLGYEGMGWFDGEFEINNLSMNGIRVSPADSNGDGTINLLDFGIWKTEYLTNTVSKADFNNDVKVNLLDFCIWKSAYLQK